MSVGIPALAITAATASIACCNPFLVVCQFIHYFQLHVGYK